MCITRFKKNFTFVYKSNNKDFANMQFIVISNCITDVSLIAIVNYSTVINIPN